VYARPVNCVACLYFDIYEVGIVRSRTKATEFSLVFMRFCSYYYFYCIIHPRDLLELNTLGILHPCVFFIEKFKSGRYGLYRQL
jgi:hypothetical protein